MARKYDRLLLCRSVDEFCEIASAFGGRVVTYYYLVSKSGSDIFQILAQANRAVAWFIGAWGEILSEGPPPNKHTMNNARFRYTVTAGYYDRVGSFRFRTQ
jgi:hypothetical protein